VLLWVTKTTGTDLDISLINSLTSSVMEQYSLIKGDI